MAAANDRLTVIASHDLVSGLANRRGFQSRLEFEWMKALQSNGQLSVLMIDVDHFKLFNDTYGHPEGDACLKRVGETLADLSSSCDGFAARYGGEEFCLLLPGGDTADALRVGEQVRAAVEGLAIPLPPLQPCQDCHGQHRHRDRDAGRRPAPGRPDRSRRRGALCGKTAGTEHGGRPRADPARPVGRFARRLMSRTAAQGRFAP